MSTIKTMTTVAAAASLSIAALLTSGFTATAQSQYTNGPDGMQPNTLAQKPHTAKRMRMANNRPLVVRRRAIPLAPAVIEVPAPVVNTGPGTIVTGPLGFGSNVVGLPFRVLAGVFPATGDPAVNSLVLIGAPLHAVGDIVQVPFRIVGAPFGGTTIATY